MGRESEEPLSPGGIVPCETSFRIQFTCASSGLGIAYRFLREGIHETCYCLFIRQYSFTPDGDNRSPWLSQRAKVAPQAISN